MKNAEIVIVGGGSAGLTAANALQQAGFGVRVVEGRETALTAELGAGIHLWPNVIDCLDRLGLAGPVLERGTVVRRHRYLTWRERQIGTLDVEKLAAGAGFPAVGVTRTHLYQTLLQALEPGTVRFGISVTGFDRTDSGVDVRTADGEILRADAVIGADGIRSVIRRQLHGPAEPRDCGLTAWHGTTDYQHPELVPGDMAIYWGPTGRILHYHVSDGELYWLALLQAPSRYPDVPGERQAEAIRRFRGWPAHVQSLVRSTPEERILRNHILDRDPLQHWGRGCATIIGDAAHPMTPDMAQGAGQGIEDGLSVALAFQREASVAEALRSFEERRRDRANGFVKSSRQVSSVSTFTAKPMIAVRNEIVLRAIYRTHPWGTAQKEIIPVL